MNTSMTKFYKIVFTLWLVLVAYPSQAQNVDFSEVEEHIEQKIKDGKLVGIFIGHISAGGEVHRIAKGTLKAGGSTPVTGQSLFEIGSISKVFTTLVLARVMQENGISLDDEAEQYLPESMSLPEYKDREIVIRDLVTHTSGLPSLPDNMFPEDSSNPYADYTMEKLNKYLAATELTRAPGSKFEYSNLGLALVGHILETVTGKEYEQLVIDKIAKPLNMNDTKIKITDTDSSRLAIGHSKGKTVANWDLPVFEGAGALRSTGNDMMVFLKTQMGNAKSALWPYTQKTQQPLFDIEKGLSRQTDKIGMGWFYATDKDTILWHSGGTGGYRSFIGINKETGSGTVVLSNSTADISDLYFHLIDSSYTLTESKESISLAPDELARFVGEYKSDMGYTLYVTNEGKQLFIRLPGQGKTQVKPVDNNKFVNEQVGAEFTFNTTKSGKVTELKLLKGGKMILARKVSDNVAQPEKREAIALRDSILKRYTGIYQITSSFSIKVTLESGQLYAQATGQQKFPVYPESRTKFFYKVVKAQLEFLETENGSFDKIKLYQAGRVLKGKRVSNVTQN